MPTSEEIPLSNIFLRLGDIPKSKKILEVHKFLPYSYNLSEFVVSYNTSHQR